MRNRVSTPSQLKAIQSYGKIILKSCPGSGKTFVVAKKMISEMENWKYKNSGIALLSFTNVAHDEVNKQIHNLSGISKIEYPHYTGTIDSFISQFLFLPFGHLIMKCKGQPSLIRDNSISISNFAKGKWQKECHNNQCEIMDFYINENDKVVNNKSNIKCTIKSNKPCINVKNILYSRGLATYQDITILAIKILKKYPDIGTILAKKFPMMIIDEAQDTSSYQMEIIDLLVKYGVENIMLIGDPDQAIYEWRDADPSVFLDKFKSNEWRSKELNENFRCSQKICDATKIFSTLSDTSVARGNTSESDFMPLLLRYNNSNKNEAIEYFIEICKKNNIKISPENVAVLVRGKAGLVGKDYSQIKDLWKTQATKLFSEATYERDYKSIKRALELAEKGLLQFFITNRTHFTNKSEVENYIRKVMPIDKWRKFVFDFCRSMPSSDKELDIWKKSINQLIINASLKYSIQVRSGVEIKTKTRDKAFKDFLKQPVKNFYATSFECEYLNSTIHAVKGRTFEAVLLLIDSRGKLTTNMINNKPIESEEIRTAYVAMTRAKQILVVAIPKSVKLTSLVRFSDTLWNMITL